MIATRRRTRATRGSSRLLRSLLILPLLALLVGCDDDDAGADLEVFLGTYDYSAFSTVAPSVTLNGSLTIQDLQASRGLASASADLQGQWAAIPLQIEFSDGAEAFVDSRGEIVIQESGTAVLRTGQQRSFEMTHEGVLSEGEIQGTFQLQVEGEGTVTGDFVAIRID
jgi:hypothetical protein